MRIADKLNEKIQNGETWFSFEYFPPKTEEGTENLFTRMDRMVSYGPAFCDITWGAGGSTADITLDIAERMQNQVCVETMMHLTCTNMPVEKLDAALEQCRKAGIQNILALRGDPPHGQDSFTKVEGGFGCALDLVKHIREKHGEYFGIGVAGYPEGHPDVIVEDGEENEKHYWSDIAYLKRKVDAGAQFVVTQLFYDTKRFLKFVTDCRSTGIQVPILPGIMPIMTYNGFKKMTSFCKTFVPAEITDQLEGLKDNDEAVKQFGIDLGYRMCQELLAHGTPGLHMYTLNQERAAVGILEKLGFIQKDKLPRVLPWRPAPNAKRADEAVRPIHWSNRPKSYLRRTADWDRYPTGRWGDVRSPAYGTLNDYQFMRRHTRTEGQKAKARAAWGEELTSLTDVKEVFVKYCRGEVAILPWSELEGLQGESGPIKEALVGLNQRGFLTINSQPKVNGLPSTDPKFGWGRQDGYVYQKAYVEFFCSPAELDKLLDRLAALPRMTYIAANRAGEHRSNVQPYSVNAVTWGVFPGKEIVQPTVVCPESFMVWKSEAFDLWTFEWAGLYEEGSHSRQVLEDIAATWYLVSVVDNDYINGDLFDAFRGLDNGSA